MSSNLLLAASRVSSWLHVALQTWEPAHASGYKSRQLLLFSLHGSNMHMPSWCSLQREGVSDLYFWVKVPMKGLSDFLFAAAGTVVLSLVECS